MTRWPKGPYPRTLSPSGNRQSCPKDIEKVDGTYPRGMYEDFDQLFYPLRRLSDSVLFRNGYKLVSHHPNVDKQKRRWGADEGG